MTPPSDRRTHAPDQIKIQQSLTVCWKDGVAAQIMASIVETYAVPFALLMGATNAHVAALVAIPNFLSAIAQTFSVSAVQKTGSRVRLLVRGVAIQAAAILPTGFLAFAHWPNRIWMLVAAITVYKVIGGALGPAWGSLVSEYLPPQRRGDYFGWRSRIMSFTSIATLVVCGFLLEFCEKFKADADGFMILFVVCAASRFFSLYFISQMMDLPTNSTKDDHFTLWMFLKRFRESNFVKFVFYVSSITFATNISAPYFSVHMLRNLHFDYVSFMAVTLAPILAGLVAFPLWGRHADQVGNARILKLTGLLIPIVPVLWVFTHNTAMLVLIELFAGFVWGGFNLCAVNFIYDAVIPGKRMRCLAYFNLINGMAIFAGAWLGGWLSRYLMPVFGYPLLGLFLISAALRAAAYLMLGEKFQEVRADIKPIHSLQLFFSVAGLQPFIGRANELIGLNPWVRFSLRRRRASQKDQSADARDAATPRPPNF